MLTGSSGIGKTAVMDAVGAAAATRGERVLRVAGAETERWISDAGLADLFSQVPREFVADLPEPQRDAVNSVLLRSRSGGDGQPARLARRLAWQALLDRCAQDRPVLMLVDDAQWLDAASADVIAYAARRVGARKVRAVVAERWPDHVPVAAGAGRAGSRPGADADVDVESRAGTRRGRRRWRRRRSSSWSSVRWPRTTSPTCSTCTRCLRGRLASCTPTRAATRTWRWRWAGRLPTGPRRRGARCRCRSASTRCCATGSTRCRAEVRETLLFAALSTQPTVQLLLRAGRAEAERDIRLAAATGLLVTDGSNIRFTPPSVATVVAEARDRRPPVGRAHRPVDGGHRGGAAGPARALASANPDAEVARSLVTAAEEARRRGARGLAAELYLLAADRTPADLDAERLEWLVAAAEVGSAASRAGDRGPGRRGGPRERLHAGAPGPGADRVDRPVRPGVGRHGRDVRRRPGRRRRRRGADWRRCGCGWPGRRWSTAPRCGARRRPRRRSALAQKVGDTTTEAMALAVKAQVARVLGRNDYMLSLERALALPQPPLDGWMHLTPALPGRPLRRLRRPARRGPRRPAADARAG